MCRPQATLYIKQQVIMLLQAWGSDAELPRKDDTLYVCFPGMAGEVAAIDKTELKNDYGKQLWRVTMSSRLGREFEETVQEAHVAAMRLHRTSTKDRITECLGRRGWQKDRMVGAFSKTFETIVAPKRASIWLRFERECDRWLLVSGDFTSAGENVLAGCHAGFPVGASEAEIGRIVEAFVAEMEGKIAEAYSVRLLR